MTTPVSDDGDDRDLPSVLLSPQEVAEFQRLMKEECGEDLDAPAAYLRATELVRLFRMLTQDQHEGESNVAPPHVPASEANVAGDMSSSTTAPEGIRIAYR